MMRCTALALLAASVQAAVIGIDFGARFVKVGIIQPGKGVDLVLNEASKRKSSTAAGYNNQDERIFGEESYNLIGKIPHKQFIFAKQLLGKNVSAYEVDTFTRYGFPYVFATDEDTKAAVMQYGENTTLRSEELVAYVLSYAKSIAESHAGSPIKDAVITVPPFFKTTERNAMLNAAQIAGLNVLALMHENTAFAFKFGFDKESEFLPDEPPTNVVFYDMGATSFKVSLVSFTSILGKKNKTTGSMTVKGVAWDEHLGGRDFDQIVIDMLIDAFKEKYPKVSDPRSSFRTMGKLRKEGERVKDVLSANQQFQVGIESVHEDRDLRCVVTRAEFEERAAALWPRLQAPLEALMAQANMTKEQVNRVEIVGGATRIPKVKELAAEFFGMKTSASLNGDEAAALGATYYAAKLSTSFRLREFSITDYFPYPITVKLGTDSDSAPSESEEEADDAASKSKGKDKLLFKAGTKFPHKKLITMSRSEDMLISLSYGQPTAETKEAISDFNVTGVAAALKRLSTPQRTPISKPKVSVTFALSASGLLEVAKAEVSLEMLEKYEDSEVVPLNETELAELDINGTESANGTEAAAVNDTLNGSNSTKVNATAIRTKTIKVMKERKRMHNTPLKVSAIELTEVVALNSTHIAAALAANKRQLEAEQMRALNAEAKNQVEAYIIDTRDKLGSDEVIEKVSTEEERETLRAEFDKTEDWLYEEGKDLDAKAYNKKKKEIEKMAAPIFFRAGELDKRPTVVTQALDAVNWTLNILETWATEKPEVTEEERTNVKGLAANFTKWLDGVQEKQAALEPFETPAFVSSEVTAKLEPLEKEVRRLIKKPKPKPPKAPKGSKNSTSANTTATPNATANSSSANETDSTEEELPSHDEL